MGLAHPAGAEAETRGAVLDELFRLQKEIVFGLIDQLGVEITDEERERIEEIPTRNLQAFLAYSRGLQEEDAGRFDAAAALYQQAAQLDPGFEQAADAAEAALAEAAVNGDVEAALAATREVAASGATPAATSLASARLGNLNQSLGGVVVPGSESRSPGAETPPVARTIPDPEPPPGNSALFGAR